ncbi:GntR family transcriptional regulator [Paracoccaceae bacterium]|nr:GntR family transcriptional regulator [Paracoccaceae bacterium]
MQETATHEVSATYDAYLRLREMILTGALPPGQKLKIEKLRILLETGASPIREALSLLTSDMLVERFDQRGFRAAPVGRANFDEILMLRCTMEEMALRASIKNATQDWEEMLVLAHHRMKKAQANGASDFEVAHKDFHMTLVGNALLPTLERYCSQLYDLNIRYRYLAAGEPNYEERSVASEHEDICNSVLAHDAALATVLLVDHYHRTGAYLSSQMDN